MKLAKTVGELRALIQDLPADMKIVVEGSDHSYNTANAGVTKAEVLYMKNGRYVDYIWEYFDERNRSDANSKIEEVLLVS